MLRASCVCYGFLSSHQIFLLVQFAEIAEIGIFPSVAVGGFVRHNNGFEMRDVIVLHQGVADVLAVTFAGGEVYVAVRHLVNIINAVVCVAAYFHRAFVFIPSGESHVHVGKWFVPCCFSSRFATYRDRGSFYPRSARDIGFR